MQMDNRLPNLVNLSEDPQLSEILLYVIKEGATTVGKDKPDSRHDIRLSGVLIAEHHWYAAPLGLPSRTPAPWKKPSGLGGREHRRAQGSVTWERCHRLCFYSVHLVFCLRDNFFSRRYDRRHKRK